MFKVINRNLRLVVTIKKMHDNRIQIRRENIEQVMFDVLSYLMTRREMMRSAGNMGSS